MTTIKTRRMSGIQQEERADEEMTALEAAADARDELAFLAARKVIDWETRPPQDFVRAVHLALAAGAHSAARNLAAEGATLYPDDVELRKMAYILAPPKVTTDQGEPLTTWKADREWLKAHWNEYQGQWVALRNGQLLGAASSFNSLVAQVGEVKGRTDTICR